MEISTYTGCFHDKNKLRAFQTIWFFGKIRVANKLVKVVRIGQKIREKSELFCVVKPLSHLKYLDNEKKDSRTY